MLCDSVAVPCLCYHIAAQFQGKPLFQQQQQASNLLRSHLFVSISLPSLVICAWNANDASNCANVIPAVHTPLSSVGELTFLSLSF